MVPASAGRSSVYYCDRKAKIGEFEKLVYFDEMDRYT
jgi:hypothetical protein